MCVNTDVNVQGRSDVVDSECTVTNVRGKSWLKLFHESNKILHELSVRAAN